MVRSSEALRAEYQARTPTSRALWEKGKETMPGGVSHGRYLVIERRLVINFVWKSVMEYNKGTLNDSTAHG